MRKYPTYTDSSRIYKLDEIKKLYRSGTDDNTKVLIDVKGLYSISDLNESGMIYWRL